MPPTTASPVSPSAPTAPEPSASSSAAAAASGQALLDPVIALDHSANQEQQHYLQASPPPPSPDPLSAAIRPPAPASPPTDQHPTPHPIAAAATPTRTAAAPAHLIKAPPPQQQQHRHQEEQRNQLASSSTSRGGDPSHSNPILATSKHPPPPTSPKSPTFPKMLFSDIYKSPRSPLSKLRHNIPQPRVDLPQPDYAPDLLSKDKARQKEAVKQYLAEKVRNDWAFSWPPIPVAISTPPEVVDVDAAPAPAATDIVETALPDHEDLIETAVSDPGHGPLEPSSTQPDRDTEDDEDADTDDDAGSVYSTISEDPLHYKPRMEWISDLSDEDPPMSLSPFRFDSPEAIGAAVRASVAGKRTQRRRAIREEAQWNEGLACFEARRDAWTGARTVRVRTKPVSPTSAFASLSPRRLFFRHTAPPPTSPPASEHSPPQRQSHDASAVASDSSEHSKDGSKDLSAQRTKDSSRSTASRASAPYPVETLLPIPPPLLPPANAMRASITPAVYISLYDKVVVHNLTPSCPVNLSDMMRACVAGWKRDGEWPPKSTMQDPSGLIAVRRKKKPSTEGQPTARRLSLSFLARGGEKGEKEEETGTGKGIRKSLQRVLGIGHHAATANGNPAVANNGAPAVKEHVVGA